MDNLDRKELIRLAKEKLIDAEVLFKEKRYEGAYYICGYAIEMKLKYRICLTLKWDNYLVTGKKSKDYKSFKTHDLEVLLHLSGNEKKINKDFKSEWSIVTQWNSEKRYSLEKINKEDVRLMLEATKTLLKCL